jgi:hypothetical protein
MAGMGKATKVIILSNLIKIANVEVAYAICFGLIFTVIGLQSSITGFL